MVLLKENPLDAFTPAVGSRDLPEVSDRRQDLWRRISADPRTRASRFSNNHFVCCESESAQQDSALEQHPLQDFFPPSNLDPVGSTVEEQISALYVGNPRYNALIFSPQQLNPPLQSYMLIDPTRLAEGCLARGLMSGFAGYGLGVMLGGFFHSMQPMDTSYGELSTREAIKLSYRGTLKFIARFF